jgi:hypothetical protein
MARVEIMISLRSTGEAIGRCAQAGSASLTFVNLKFSGRFVQPCPAGKPARHDLPKLLSLLIQLRIRRLQNDTIVAGEHTLHGNIGERVDPIAMNFTVFGTAFRST